MIEFVFTIDYEIYGNGQGSLREIVYEPTQELSVLFGKWNAGFVVFPDFAELEMIEASGGDSDFDLIKGQLRALYQKGIEIGLHIHPWWYNARRENDNWILDYGVYNLCTQPKVVIDQIIDRSIAYSRKLLAAPNFTPRSFRAGHLLFQPTQPLSDTLADRGIIVDSSVYKGGLWHQHNLDYRRAPRTEYCWKFTNDAAKSEPEGLLLEVPIYTCLAPFWRLYTSRRVGLQRAGLTVKQTGKKVLGRLHDIMRLHYPLKFDLGQMTKSEMTQMVDRIINYDKKRPSTYRPIVAIMHTKDRVDFCAVDSLLARLRESSIKISTLFDVYNNFAAFNKDVAERWVQQGRTAV